MGMRIGSIGINESGSGGGSGSGTPASPDKSVQFNDAGAFGGSPGLVWEEAIKSLQIRDFTLGPYTSFPNLYVNSPNDPKGTPTITLGGSDGLDTFTTTFQSAGHDDTSFFALKSAGGFFSGLNSTGGIFFVSQNTSGPIRWGFGDGSDIGLPGEALRMDSTGVLSFGPFPSISTKDIGVSRNAANVLEVNTGTAGTFATIRAGTVQQAGANGQLLSVLSLSELTTIAAAPTTDTVIQIPANAVVFGVDVRVTVAIPTAATFTVTGATSGTTFNTAAVSTAANSTDPGTKSCPFYNATAQSIRITPDATPAANTGRVRVTIHYYTITPATS